MSLLDLDNLLLPVTEHFPGGEDLEYDAEFMALEQDIEGTAEQQMGDSVIEAADPNWKDVQQRSAALLKRSRDLRILLIHIRAAIRIEGFAALADGLNLMNGWVDQFWESLFPLFDPEDDNDPTERVNVFMTFCDLEVMLQPLLQSPIVDSKALGQFSLQDIRTSEAEDRSEDAPDSVTISAAFTDAELELLQEINGYIESCIQAAQDIEAKVTDLVGVTDAPNFAPFLDLLNEIQGVLSEQIGLKGGLDTGQDLDNEFDEGISTGAAPQSLQGEIRNSQDVIRAIEKICDYYQKNEPSSPVPILLERAKRLVNMDFLAIVRDLASDGVSQVENFIGFQQDEEEY